MIILVLIVFGLISGSFINAVVWRLHEQSVVQKSTHKKTDYINKLSIIHGRSMCPVCKHKLAAKDLVPLFSWLGLLGKCRYCHSSISKQYPIVEMVTALLFVISYVFWPQNWAFQSVSQFVFWLIILVGLIGLSVYDIRWYILPNKIVYPLFVIVATDILLRIVFYSGGKNLLISTLWGLVIGGGVFWVLHIFSKGNWIGGGDVKLGSVLGLLLGGPLDAMLLIFLASLGGSIVSIPLLATQRIKKNAHLPFGPFLVFSAIVLQLFGASLIKWLQLRGVLPVY